MRLVNIEYLEEGEVLARSIVNSRGSVLLKSGIILTDIIIKRLKKLGYDMLFIEDETFDDVEVYSAISAKTRELSFNALNNITRSLSEEKASNKNYVQVEDAIKNIIEDILHSRDLLGNVLDIQGYDEYTYHHSINTTILALIMAVYMGWSNSKLMDLGMGVMLHDVGKTKIPDCILNKQGRLTVEEYEIIKKHAEYGFEILRNNRDLSLLSAHVAFQHQERWDGSGYPRGLKEIQIHEYGRISAIADVYEALTSKRVYRKAVPPYEAYEYMTAKAGVEFDPRFVNQVFTRCIAPYPTGTGVRLSNGQRGNVVKQNSEFPTRPYVRVTHQEETRISTPMDYNLADHPSLMIVCIENK